jgi:copper chaperone CopZ
LEKENPMSAIQLEIDGMHCQGCVARATKVLSSVPGVTVENVAIGSAKVEVDETVTTPDSLIQTLQKRGYKTRLQTPETPPMTLM